VREREAHAAQLVSREVQALGKGFCGRGGKGRRDGDWDGTGRSSTLSEIKGIAPHSWCICDQSISARLASRLIYIGLFLSRLLMLWQQLTTVYMLLTINPLSSDCTPSSLSHSPRSW
jgi:hypothetical protein